MDLFASIFDIKSKCHSCSTFFKLTSKRRKCVICSKKHLEYLYCKKCSKKVSKHGFFSSKRYCNFCLNAESQKGPKEKQSRKKIESLEQAAADIGLTKEELLRNREQFQEVVKTVNDGVRSMPRTSSVTIK